jgi:hypothetical protein
MALSVKFSGEKSIILIVTSSDEYFPVKTGVPGDSPGILFLLSLLDDIPFRIAPKRLLIIQPHISFLKN